MPGQSAQKLKQALDEREAQGQELSPMEQEQRKSLMEQIRAENAAADKEIAAKPQEDLPAQARSVEDLRAKYKQIAAESRDAAQGYQNKGDAVDTDFRKGIQKGFNRKR
jgi:hypothetical protein